jgi:hypothetical protein
MQPVYAYTRAEARAGPRQVEREVGCKNSNGKIDRARLRELFADDR